MHLFALATPSHSLAFLCKMISNNDAYVQVNFLVFRKNITTCHFCIATLPLNFWLEEVLDFTNNLLSDCFFMEVQFFQFFFHDSEKIRRFFLTCSITYTYTLPPPTSLELVEKRIIHIFLSTSRAEFINVP